MILVMRSAFLLHMKYFKCVFLSFVLIPNTKRKDKHVDKQRSLLL